MKPSITLCINQKATEHPIAPPPTTIISYWASKPLIKNKSIIELVLFQTPIHSFWIPPFAKPFWENIFYFIERGIFASNCKFSNKNDLLCAWRDFNKTFCGISTYHKWMFKLQISSIFNFDRAHQSWISGLLGVDIWHGKAIVIPSAGQRNFITAGHRWKVWINAFCTARQNKTKCYDYLLYIDILYM